MCPPPKRSNYNKLVYEIVRVIPRGKVMTYGGIAALIPPPAGIEMTKYVRVRARWVGYAMASCEGDLPWHRVINAQGQVSQRPGHGSHIQRKRLEEEGVIFDAKGRVDLRTYRWEPTTDWLLSRGLMPPPAEMKQNTSQPKLL